MEYMAKMQRGYSAHPKCGDFRVLVSRERAAFRRSVRELKRDGFRVMVAYKRGLSRIDGPGVEINGGGDVVLVSKYNTAPMDIRAALS